MSQIHQEILAAAQALGVFVCPPGRPEDYYVKKAAKQYVQNCLAKGIDPSGNLSQAAVDFLRDENWVPRGGSLAVSTIIRYGNVETRSAALAARVNEPGFNSTGSDAYNLFDYAVVVGCIDGGIGMSQMQVALRLALDNDDLATARLLEEELRDA
ncbi:MAG: hypothetical protein HWN51_06580 [Desulfobacterales bacterium]|nr:hypothetical protein [Desulfobacterales bacterium]